MCIHTDNKVSHPWRKHCFLPFCTCVSELCFFLVWIPCFFYWFFFPPARWLMLSVLSFVFIFSLFVVAHRETAWSQRCVQGTGGVRSALKFRQLTLWWFCWKVLRGLLSRCEVHQPHTRTHAHRLHKHISGAHLRIFMYALMDLRHTSADTFMTRILPYKSPPEINWLPLLVFSPAPWPREPGLKSVWTWALTDSILVVNGQGQRDLTSIWLSGIRRLSGI